MLYSWKRAYSPPLQSLLVPGTFKEVPKVRASEQYFSYVTEENGKEDHRCWWRNRMKLSYDLHSPPRIIAVRQPGVSSRRRNPKWKMMRVNPRKAEKSSSSLLSSFMQLVEKNVLCISRSTVILLKATQTQQGWVFGTIKPTWDRAQLQPQSYFLPRGEERAF